MSSHQYNDVFLREQVIQHFWRYLEKLTKCSLKRSMFPIGLLRIFSCSRPLYVDYILFKQIKKLC